MLEIVQKVGQPQAKEYDLNELVEKFRKRFPPEFHGIEDPAVAYEWVVQMEKIYEVFKCMGVQQVQLAAHMFHGAAERWWKTVKHPYKRVEEEVAWKTFTEQFQKKFIPEHYRDQKMEEFERLMQGDLLVQKYEISFTHLSRFAENLIKPKLERVRRFIKGPRADIKMQVQCSKLTDYDDVVKEAYWAEESLKEVIALEQQRILALIPQPKAQGSSS
ncbi:hypothetical protein AAC387_Pa09g0960 [Persea americana]